MLSFISSIPQPQVFNYLVYPPPPRLFCCFPVPCLCSCRNSSKNCPIPCFSFWKCQSTLRDSRKLTSSPILPSIYKMCCSLLCIPMAWEHWTRITSNSLFMYQMVSSSCPSQKNACYAWALNGQLYLMCEWKKPWDCLLPLPPFFLVPYAHIPSFAFSS